MRKFGLIMVEDFFRAEFWPVLPGARLGDDWLSMLEKDWLLALPEIRVDFFHVRATVVVLR